MDKLKAIEAFIAIAENGSLTEAGLRVGRSLPTMVRTLAELETSLGTRLFNRSTRRVDLTEEGQAYLAHCRGMLADLAETEGRIRRERGTPSGSVAVTAPIRFGELHVAPILSDVHLLYPGLSLRLHLNDRFVDLLDGHFDLAIRIGRMADSGLRVRRIGAVRQVLCAAPALIARTGAPRHPEYLSALPCLRNDGNNAGNLWPFVQPADGAPFSVRVGGPFTANLVRPLTEACVAGHGFALFLSYQVADELRTGRLVELLPAFQPAALPVQIVHAYARTVPARVAAVADALAAGLAPRLDHGPPAPP